MMKTKNIKTFLPAAVCSFGQLRFDILIKYIACIISQSVIPFIFALAVAVFIWGIIQYLMGAEEEAKRAQGRQFMIWGIIALAVMISIWGLVSILGNTFGIKYFIPQVQDTTLSQ